MARSCPTIRSHSLRRRRSELYLSVAQVHANNNPERGIPRLANAIDRYHPEQAEFYVELGDALRRNGKPGDAIPRYRGGPAAETGFRCRLARTGSGF